MNMINKLMIHWLSRFFAGSTILAAVLLVSCGDDPQPANEEELITTLTVTLTSSGGAPITMTFKDLDGSGPGTPTYTYSSGGNEAILLTSTTYAASLTLLNESVTPSENITTEIEEEADEHLFCFQKTGLSGLSINYADTEADYIGSGVLPVGLTTTWTTTSESSGAVKITLRHQPGTKNGDCPGSGDTDIEVTFNIVIQ